MNSIRKSEKRRKPTEQTLTTSKEEYTQAPFLGKS